MKAPKKARKKAPKKAPVDLYDLAAQLSDALAFVEVAVSALSAEDDRNGPELHVLEHGMRELVRVHEALDRVSMG